MSEDPKRASHHVFKGLNLHFFMELTRDFKCPNCTVIKLLSHYVCFSMNLCTWFKIYLRLVYHNGNDLNTKLHTLEVTSHRMGEHSRKGPPALWQSAAGEACSAAAWVRNPRPRAPSRPRGEKELGHGEQKTASAPRPLRDRAALPSGDLL